MFEKFKEHVLHFKLKLYCNLGDYCFGKVKYYESKHNDFWLSLTEKFTHKEFEVIDKLYGDETYI